MLGYSQRTIFAGFCLLLFWQSGCAAFRPMNGVPARYLPAEMKIGERSGRRTINLDLLTQPRQTHLIDAGDVLGVYIEGVVGKASDPPPVHFPQNNDSPPSFGLPYPVRDDGTISLPIVGSVNLRGLTVVQAEEKVTQAYLKPRQILKDDNLRVQVNLQRPRQYRVLVIRQDSRMEPQSNAVLGQMNIGTSKRGTGKLVNLPAYSNDVLNALAAADGLPGLDAENAVYVIRRRGNYRNGPIDSNLPVNFDPSTLIRDAKAVKNLVSRGQSPTDGSESSYLHFAEIKRTNPIVRPQSSIRSAAQSAIDANSLATNQEKSFGTSIRSTDSIQPPRIWPDRTMTSPNSPSPPEKDATGIAAAGFQSPPNTTTTQASNFQFGNGLGNGLSPSMGPPANYPQSGYPPVNAMHANNPAQNYPPQGASVQGYPIQGDMPPGYSTQALPPQGNSLQNYPPSIMPPAYQNGPPSYSANPSMQPNGPIYNAPPLSPTPIGPPTVNHETFGASPGSVVPQFEPQPGVAPGHVMDGNAMEARHVIRIPIRLGPGETADIRQEDVILNDGDIVFIESRDTEVFYTGGLLGGGQYVLPRDYDLDIMQAISLAQSRATTVRNAVGGVSALNNDVAISPSTAIVIRQLDEGSEVAIKVDLYRARVDKSERIIIQPGDFILLQYTKCEAIGAFFERHLLETALFGLTAQQLNKNGTSN